jgi:hypothetical protein
MVNSIYCLEIFNRAIWELATGQGEIKPRLKEATKELVMLNPDQVPDEIRDKFKMLIKELTKKKRL